MKQDQSIAYHRKRTKDNLFWILIVIGFIVYGCSGCVEQKNNCRLTRGFVGYGNR